MVLTPDFGRANMLRFFSRRKAKGRAEQKVGMGANGGQARKGKPSKYVVACNIVLLDGEHLALDMAVRMNVAHLNSDVHL